jgi:Flp pilus assembly protein TadG
MSNVRARKIQIRDQQGQTVTEFALVLPVLALILFAVIQFGIVFNNYVTLTDATRAVGRQFADPAGTAVAAVRASAKDLKQKDLSISVNSNWQPTADVSVTATYPYKVSLLGMVVKSGRLTSTTTERVE